MRLRRLARRVQGALAGVFRETAEVERNRVVRRFYPVVHARYMNTGQRALALAVDTFIIAAVGAPLAVAANIAPERPGAVATIVALALPIAYAVYFHGRFGQTPGKMLAGIRVLDQSDEAGDVSYGQAVLRSGVDVAFATPLAAGAVLVFRGDGAAWLPAASDLGGEAWWLWLAADVGAMFFNGRHRTLHDVFAGTVVRKSDSRPSAARPHAHGP